MKTKKRRTKSPKQVKFKTNQLGFLVFTNEKADYEITIYPPNKPDVDPKWLADGFPDDPVPLRYYNTYEDVIKDVERICNVVVVS